MDGATKAVRYHGPGMPFRLDNVPKPEPGMGEVRVRIEAAGMCHTELHFESGLLSLRVSPLTAPCQCRSPIRWPRAQARRLTSSIVEPVAHLRSELDADLLFLIDDRVCSGHLQLPSVDVISGAHDDRCIGRENAHLLNDVSGGPWIWDGYHNAGGCSDVQACENFVTRRVSNQGPKPVAPCEIRRATCQFHDEYVKTALSHHQLGDPLSGGSETDDHEMIAKPLRHDMSPV